MQTYNEPSKRLELLFRSRIAGGRPVYADRCDCNRFVLKVRRRKLKTENVSHPSLPTEYEYDVQLLGTVTTAYKFQSVYFLSLS